MTLGRGPFLRRAIAFFVVTGAVATIACGLIYVVGQQALRSGGNDPQLQMAEDAAAALGAGAKPDALVARTKVDVGTSLSPFLVIFDAAGNVLATDGALDGHDPAPPPGVLVAARTHSPNMVTWQPRSGVRVASVTVPWGGGTVMAGRSLREVERREDQLLLLVAAGWLLGLVGVAAASLVAASLWPAANAEPAPLG